MSLLNEYYDRDKRKPTDLAKRILFAVLYNIGDRRGLHFRDFDEDIQEEIFTTNLKIIRNLLPKK